MSKRSNNNGKSTATSVLDRRRFLVHSGQFLTASALTIASAHLPAAPALIQQRGEPLGMPFTLGVASGDPLSNAVVIWTRLAPEPQQPGGGMPDRTLRVHWEVANDQNFRQLARSGITVARPQYGHSVHVDVRGLQPGRDYWYRFWAEGAWSPVGRTRTAPAPGTMPERFRYAFASCQDYEDGYYTAYEHLVEEDLDLVIFLGDYIYEGAPKPVGGSVVRSHTGNGEPVTLEEYRIRYALYKADPLLQAAHAAFPWAVTLDDHEVDNDWSADIPQDPENQSREAFLVRRAAAFQAYWEHMPLRFQARPSGPDMRLYRRLSFGDLVEFNVLDTRQYRSVTEPCGYGTGPACDAVSDPTRTMLGDRQERWLLRGLDRSHARWNVLAQQVPITRLDVGPGDEVELKLDKWDAYPVARQRLLDFLAERQPSNPVVITGDLHDNWVALLLADFDNPASAPLATEFIGTSISSDGDGAEISEEGEIALRKNPHVLFHNYRRGYLRCDINPREWVTDFRTVPFVEQPGAAISTRASFVLEDGNPVAKEIV